MGIFSKKLSPELQRDAEMARRIADGDAEALEAFYHRYFDKLYRYIYFRVGQDHQLTEDILQDTFIEAVEKINHYDPERGNLEAWVVLTSKNRIATRRNAVEKVREHEFSWDPTDKKLEWFGGGCDERTPLKNLESQELENLIGATMGNISADYSKVLELKYLANMPVREIARLTQRTEKSVESQLVRARLAFRQALTELTSSRELLAAHGLGYLLNG